VYLIIKIIVYEVRSSVSVPNFVNDSGDEKHTVCKIKLGGFCLKILSPKWKEKALLQYQSKGLQYLHTRKVLLSAIVYILPGGNAMYLSIKKKK